jgi:hypothetical protein
MALGKHESERKHQPRNVKYILTPANNSQATVPLNKAKKNNFT